MLRRVRHGERLDRLKGIEIPVASEVSLFHRMENVDIIELGFPFPQIFTRSSVSRSSHTWKLRVEVEDLQFFCINVCTRENKYIRKSIDKIAILEQLSNLRRKNSTIQSGSFNYSISRKFRAK